MNYCLYSPLHGKAKKVDNWVFCEDGEILEYATKAHLFDNLFGLCSIQGCLERTKSHICTGCATQIRTSLDFDIGQPSIHERMEMAEGI